MPENPEPLWRATFLGATRIEGPNGPVERLRTRTAFVLLAYLLLHRSRVHAREELADRFWSEDDPEAARGKLRLALHSIRSELGDLLAADRHAVRIAQPDRVVSDRDEFLRLVTRVEGVDRLDRLTRALALCQGPFLPGFYDAWALDERERLEALKGGALRETAKARGAAGRWTEALDAAERLVALEPYDEEAHVLVLESLCALGRREAVDRALDWTRERFAELGGRPGPAIEAFARAAPAAFEEDEREPAFLGRERELEGVVAEVGRSGLTTLWGPPGVGKTRLAKEALRVLGGRTATVSAVGIESVEALGSALRAALGLDAAAMEELSELAEALPPIVVALDNFESLPEEAAGLLARIRDRNPDIRFLVASQRRLGLPDEAVVALAPLDVPPEGASAAQIGASASVRLLRERVRERGRRLRIDAGNAPAFGALCRRLEGLPLALELAAEWLDVLGPAEVVARLDDSRRLASRLPGRDPRHLSLDAAIRASVDRLEGPLRHALRALATSVGGWDLAAAQALLPGEDAAGVLAALEDRALVKADHLNGSVRYTMLESIRLFARATTPAAAREAALLLHAAHYVEVCRARGEDDKAFAAARRADDENVRQAAETVLATEADAERAARAITEFVPLWRRLGRWRLYSSCARQALDRLPPEPTPLRAKLYAGLGYLGHDTDDFALCEWGFAQALAIQVALGDADAVAIAEGRLGFARFSLGDFEGAIPFFERHLAAARVRHLANPGNDVRDATHNLGDLLLKLGRHEEGTRLLEESLRLSIEGEAVFPTALNYGALGWDLRLRGHLEAAEPYLRRAAELYAQTDEANLKLSSHAQLAILLADRGNLGHARAELAAVLEFVPLVNRPFGYAEAAEAAAWVSHAAARPAPAARLLGARRSWRRRATADSPPHAARLRELESALAAALGPESFARETLCGETAGRAEVVEAIRLVCAKVDGG